MTWIDCLNPPIDEGGARAGGYAFVVAGVSADKRKLSSYEVGELQRQVCNSILQGRDCATPSGSLALMGRL
jgi:hypothetical protein